MSRSDVLERTLNCLAAVLGVDRSELTATTNSNQVDAWDSMAQIELMVSLEEDFGIEFSPEETVRLTTVPLLQDAIFNKLERSAANSA